MKLTNEQAETVIENLGLSVISENHEIQPELEKALGEHTFFISDKGLFVFSPQANDGDKGATARLFIVATWSSEEKDQLLPANPPSPVDILFDLTEGTILGES